MRALVSDTLTGTPLGYPIVALCHGDPAALGLPDWPIHLLQKIIDEVNVGVGQLIILVLGQSLSVFQVYSILKTKVSSVALPWLVHSLQQ